MLRDISIFIHAICETIENDKGHVYQVRDFNESSQFFDNSFVMNNHWLRLYKCFVLWPKTKVKVVAFCLVDTQPKGFKYGEVGLIIELGLMVEDLIN